MLDRFNQHIANHFSFLQKKKLLVACSGGVDSVVLVYLLKALGHTVSIAHCNFLLRGEESDGDENFVRVLADKLSIPVFVERFDTLQFSKSNKQSTQMAARELRYTWFEELRTRLKFDYVLTGHHMDDDMETFFINLSRGTGLRGLQGIPMLNTYIARPLLAFSREEIVNYARHENIGWREDSSNASSYYLRNQLRNDVLPTFKGLNNETLANFKKTQDYLQASQRLVNDYMALIQNLVVSESEEGYVLDIAKLKELPNVDALLYELLHPFGFSAWSDVSDLLDAQTGKQVRSGTHRLIKDRNRLLLSEMPSEEKQKSVKIVSSSERIKKPIRLSFELVEEISVKNENIIYIDNNKLAYPLELRRWEEGDVFYPFGMKGKKKLSKFFKDEKLSLVGKEKIWLLCDEKNIVWIVGMRADDRYKIDKNTTELLKITYTE